MYNPYDNFVYQNMYRPQMIRGTRFVDGLAGAQSCVTPLGSKTLLMDNNSDRFYIKETDMNGVSTISQYAFTKIEEKPAQASDYITREEFEKWKEQYESAIKQQPDSTLQQQSADFGSSASVPADNANNAAGGQVPSPAVPQEQFRFDR